MKKRLAILFLIIALLFAFIFGVVHTKEDPISITEPTEEATCGTTIPIIETTEATMHTSVPETTEVPTYPVTEPPTTAPMVTEPPTEPEETDNGLRSLGTFKLTAYCSCQQCCGSYALNRPVDDNGEVIVYGSIGVRLEAGVSIAVDPRVIPYRTQVVISGHTYIAHDTGGNIKGNRIDVYFDDHQEARDFGIQYAEVFVYG